MDNFIDERDFKILESDRYTFFVLTRIMTRNCELLLSDHSRMIICYSQSPFPVWIWTADNLTPQEMETVYKISDEHGFLDGKHGINMKYELAEYFIKRAADEGKKLSILKNMFAYDCPKPVDEAVLTKTDGEIHLCTMDDLDALTDFKESFHTELQLDLTDRAGYRKDSQALIEDGHTYLWKNADGKFVASCDFRVTNNMASLSLVFTLTDFRRKHYAENLVYQVTKEAAKLGYLPMLYTDADYAASNACYVKIGYILRGKLCTIG
ncbi:MAG: hypothetical protein K6A89_03405 [Treponema sp.]|nr:hypothetical protein [Treponema sp.]